MLSFPAPSLGKGYAADGAGGSGDPFFSNVVLLVGADTAVVDESSYGHTITALDGLATRNTANAKFGAAAMALAVSDGFASTSTDYNLGSGDCTIETWGKFSSVSGQARCLISIYDIFDSSQRAWDLTLTSTGQIAFSVYGGATLTSSGLSPTASQYYHIAMSRNGNVWRLFWDGVMVAKVTNSTAIPTTSGNLRIGSVNGGNRLSGYEDEVRITKGIGRYNSDASFTPPTSVYPRAAGPATFTGTPSISGTPQVGQTLTVSPGAYEGNIAFQWEADGSPISGATSDSYQVALAYQGATITCDVTVSSSYPNSITKTATGVGPVAAPTAYRYFLLEFASTGNGYIGCSTLKLLDTGSTDRALQSQGATATAVGYTENLPTYPVTKVNDNDDSSFTTSSNGSAAGAGKGIQIDLGQTRTIQKVGYRARGDNFGAPEAITSGSIKAKVNSGDAWTTLYTISESGWTQGQYREWTLF